jgi:hypothetical protein
VNYLQPITHLYATDNLGGLLDLQVARKADVNLIPDPVNGVVYGNITFFQNGFVSWSPTQESQGLDSNSRVGREGASKANRVKLRVPKNRADLRTMFLLAESDEFIIIFKDANGKQWLFGLVDTPVRFRFDQTSGTAQGDLNHYAGEFYYDGPDNLFEYNGAISTAPAGTAPAIVRFNGDVIASLAPGEVLDIDSEFGYTDFYITS